MPGGNPTILGVMHPTHDPDYDVNESRRSVDNPNAFLSVGYLYEETNLLRSNRNETLSLDVHGAARGTPVEVTQERVIRAGLRCEAGFSGFTDNFKYIVGGFIVVLAFVIFRHI